MYRRIIVCLAVYIGFIAPASLAGEPNDYINPGRELLFNGSLSGVRAAYQIFENGLQDTSCTECQTNRELTFFHCLADTAMLFVRDDSNSIDSVFELMRNFGVTISGEHWAPYFEPNMLDFNDVRNQHNVYEIPQDAPDITEFINILDTSFIPEIEEIIADLNSISDTPTDRFRIYLSADELKIFYPSDYDFEEPLEPVEVDYGEVLLLKGMLTALKAQLEFKAAYDIYIAPNDKLFEKLYGGSLNINDDILLPHPEILNVLPTANDSNDGAAILAQANDDLINAINYYFDMVDYIRSEEDLQSDDFFYIDPNDEFLAEELENRLTILRDSLINDTVATFPLETTKTYNVYDANSVYAGQLTVVYNFSGIDGDSGSLIFTNGNLAPSPWDIDWCGITETNQIEIDLEYYSQYQWRQGYFQGDLSEDGNTILNATLEYWGDSSGTLNDLSGQIVSVEVEDANIDLNPIFGSTTRYPNPVNPRDLLLVFDQWNDPLPGTAGHGLGDDPTLGGVLPQMTQYGWQKEFGLQPGGLVYLDSVSSSQITVDGDMSDWDAGQLVFNDISGDTDEDSHEVNGVDIKNLYMAYDRENFYGAIDFYDDIGSGDRQYNLFLSYSPDSSGSLHSINIEIYIYDGVAYGSLCYMDTDDYGWTDWQCLGSFTAELGQNAVEFKIPFDDMPDYLPGRYITVNSNGWTSDWSTRDGEWNQTHLKIGEVENISGTIAYNGFQGSPIFVQAYTDPQDPEESAVATVMITEPGQYTLEGIGLGWQGYVRAFTPVFGFDNPFESGAFQIQTATPVFMMYDDLDDVDITLNYPIELKKDILRNGEIDSETREVDWYYFDAVAGGTYTIDLTRLTADYAFITLYERNADDEAARLDYWQEQHIEWYCRDSGRYYIKVANGEYQSSDGTYQIQMTGDIACPQTDIADSQWFGVKDCKVNFYDLAAFVSQWLNNCSEPFWCGQADFNKSGSTNFSDFAAIADEWMLNGI
jgi:hypothetical protein